MPRSKRMLASVFSPRALLVRRTDSALKCALSKTIVLVSFVTSESPPPMTPATATARSASAMTSISGDSSRCFPSSVSSDFARSGRPHANLAAAEASMVERMHRLTELEQHVVGDVHDVAGGPHAGGAQARLHPVRRRSDRHVRDCAGVARTQIGVLDDDVDVALFDSLQGRQMQRRAAVSRTRAA